MKLPTIPVIDLRNFVAGAERQQFVAKLGQALHEVGFFALQNHGVDPALVDRAYQIAHKFFALPVAQKEEYENLAIAGQRGYTAFRREYAKDNAAPDLKEFWHVGRPFAAQDPLAKVYPSNVWPREVPEFQDIMLKLYEQLESCASLVLQGCALFLAEPQTLLSDFATKGDSVLRLIHYPPIDAHVDPASVRAAAHEDINFITLLFEATSAGLQIRDRHGRWIPVVTPPGCVIVNVGDMLQNLSNGYLRSTTHQVANPDSSRERRFSMPFFVHPRGEVDLTPLESCVARTSNAKSYPSIKAREFLQQRLRENGLIK